MSQSPPGMLYTPDHPLCMYVHICTGTYAHLGSQAPQQLRFQANLHLKLFKAMRTYTVKAQAVGDTYRSSHVELMDRIMRQS